MNLNYDVEKDALYRLGFEEGFGIGLVKRYVAVRGLQLCMTYEQISKITEFDIHFVDKIDKEREIVGKKKKKITAKIMQKLYMDYDENKEVRCNDDLYYEIGLERGIYTGLSEIIIRCLKQGKTYEETAELTGLDIKAIAKIDKERKKK